jgi:TolB-like protein/class 3 adenylate cyclase
MADQGGGRRLAAILAADVVGYSRLMAADEAGTHARLKALRKQFIEPKIGEHHGRLVKLTGDGALVEFGSALDAVACAVEIQRGVALRNAGIPPDQQIRFRLGINLGDVIFDDDDIYGDGVNVAARLEALAEPGGVCISAKVHDEVRNKLGFGYKDLGPQTVKNIPEPVRAYRVLTEPGASGKIVHPTLASRGRRLMAWRLPAVAAALALMLIGVGLVAWLRSGETAPKGELARLDPHRVAVLPFLNISADAADEYFSDGMTEELISHLSKIGRLRVIARTSSMKYKGTKEDVGEIGRALQVGTILEGSVRKAGNQVRITAQLIDVKSQAHLWSEDYDRKLEDIFAIQASIAEQVADALQIALLAREQHQIEKQGTDNLEAYNLYLEGLYFWNQQTRGSLYKAKAYWEQAIEKDPNYAAAYAWLAEFHLSIRWYADVSADQAYRNARAAAEKALELDDTLPEAQTALAYVKLQADWDWPAAEGALKRAIALNPSFTRAHALYGHRYLLTVERRDDQAIAELKRAVELDPFAEDPNELLAWVLYHAQRFDEAQEQFHKVQEMYPDTIWPHAGLGQIYIFKRMYNEGIAEIQKAVDLSNGYSYMLGYLGWAYGMAGRDAEARQVVERLKQKALKESVAPFAFVWVYMGLQDKDRAFEWLDKAYEVRDMNMIFLRVPEFKQGLAPDPRYNQLLERMKLPTN